MVRLLYVCRVDSAFNDPSLDRFVAADADDLVPDDLLTGAVLSCRTHLIYVLEGWQQRVTDAMVELFNDRSYKRSVIAEQVLVGARQFGKCSRWNSEAAGYFERCINDIRDAPADEKTRYVERLIEVVRVYAVK